LLIAIERDGAFGPDQGRAENGLGDDHDRRGIAFGACVSGNDEDQDGVGGSGNEGGRLLRGVLRYGSISRSGKRVVMEGRVYLSRTELGWVGESRTRGRLANISTRRAHLKETHTR